MLGFIADQIAVGAGINAPYKSTPKPVSEMQILT